MTQVKIEYQKATCIEVSSDISPEKFQSLYEKMKSLFGNQYRVAMVGDNCLIGPKTNDVPVCDSFYMDFCRQALIHFGITSENFLPPTQAMGFDTYSQALMAFVIRTQDFASNSCFTYNIKF